MYFSARDIVSKNDFYEDIRPLLLLCKFFGKTSLKNIFFGNIKFEWGINCLWPVFLLAIQISILLLNALNTNVPNVWLWVTDNTLRESFHYLTTLYSDFKSPTIMANIYKFDLMHGRPQNCHRGPRHFVVAYIVFSCLLISFAISDILKNKLTFKFICETVNRYSTSIFPLMYLYFCDEMHKRFQLLKTRWQTHIVKMIEIEPKSITCHAMEFERLAHAKLCDIVNDICIAFGPRIIIYLLFVFFDNLASFYFLFYVKPAFLNSHPNISSSFSNALEPFVFLAHTLTGTYLIANMSDLLTKSSKCIIRDLRNIQLWKLPKSYSEQIKFFMSQVHKSKTNITASGLFVVNKTLLSSIVMSLATYIIVVIQISPDLNHIFIEHF